MIVFGDIEMEFFDVEDATLEDPEDGEEVLIILKSGVPKSYTHSTNLIQSIFRKYKAVPSKFERYNNYGKRLQKFTKDQIVCWGRLKTK